MNKIESGFWTIFTVHVIITILFRSASTFKMKQSRGWKWKIGAILGVGYVIYIICAVCRVIEPGIGGEDAYGYYDIYCLSENRNLMEYYFILFEKQKSTTEPFVVIVYWMSMHFAHNYRFALFILHTIAYVYGAKFVLNIDVKKNSLLAFLGTFLIVGNLFEMFNLVRNSLALLILSMAILRMCFGKMDRAMVLILFALSVHTSAIFVLFLWIIIYCKNKGMMKTERRTCAMFLLVNLLVLMGTLAIKPLIFLKYSMYYVKWGGSLAIGSYLIIAITLLISRKSMKIAKNKTMQYETVILLFTLVCSVIHLQYWIAYRMVYNVLPILYAYIMKLTDGVCLKKKRYQLSELLMFGLGLFYFGYKCYSGVFKDYQYILPYISRIL